MVDYSPTQSLPLNCPVRYPKGGSPFLVSISSLGAGIDYPNIRLVVHIDEPDGLMEFVQESGHGGWDGAGCQVYCDPPARVAAGAK